MVGIKRAEREARKCHRCSRCLRFCGRLATIGSASISGKGIRPASPLRTLTPMPVTYHIDASRKLVISKATGILTAADMFVHQARLRSDPMFRPEYSQLADFTEVTEVQVTAEDIRGLATGSPFRARARRALVVPRPVLFGLARMFQAITEGQDAEVRLFDNLAEASRWLGLSP